MYSALKFQMKSKSENKVRLFMRKLGVLLFMRKTNEKKT